MLNELKENLNIIYNETTEKLIPRNIKKGVEILGIVGTLEGFKDAYQIIPIISSYSVSNPNNDTYTFVKNGNGYYESNNKAVDSSFALCKVVFNVINSGSNITFDCINYAESSYDYGIFSQLDTTLTSSNTADSGYYFSFSGKQKSTVQQVIYKNVSAGQHYVYIKYRKDGSVNSNNDSLQFKLLTEDRKYENIYIYDTEEHLLNDKTQADGSYGVVQLDIDCVGDMYKYSSDTTSWTKVYKIERSSNLYDSTTTFKSDTLSYGSDFVGVIYGKNQEIPLNIYRSGETKLTTFKDTVTLSSPILDDELYSITNATNTAYDYDYGAFVAELTKTYFRFSQKYSAQASDDTLEDYVVEYESTDGVTYTQTRNTFPVDYNVYIRASNYDFVIRGTYNDSMGKFLFTLGNKFSGLYYKSTATSTPSLLSTQLYCNTQELPNSATVYGNNGVVSGTLFSEYQDGDNATYKLQTYQRLKNLIETHNTFDNKAIYIQYYAENELPITTLGDIIELYIAETSLLNLDLNMGNVETRIYITNNRLLENVTLEFGTTETINIVQNIKLKSLKLSGKITGSQFPSMRYNNSLESIDTTGIEFENNLTSMSNTFAECITLTNEALPTIDTSLVTTFASCFSGCDGLTVAPNYNYANTTSFSSTFSNCSNLEDASNLSVHGVLTTMNSCFTNDAKLVTVPVFNLGGATSASAYSGTFANCTSLSNESLNNIMATLLTVPATVTSNKTLKYAGLSAEQCTVCATLSNYAALTSAGWTTGY